MVARWGPATRRRLSHLPVHVMVPTLILLVLLPSACPAASLLLLVMVRMVPLLVLSILPFIVVVVVVLVILLSVKACRLSGGLRVPLIVVLLLSRLLVVVILLLIGHGDGGARRCSVEATGATEKPSDVLKSCGQAAP
jgi:hypothetical protein